MEKMTSHVLRVLLRLVGLNQLVLGIWLELWPMALFECFEYSSISSLSQANFNVSTVFK